MSLPPVALGLLAVALLDASFAGFRASLGRTGLVDHRAADRVAARRGLGLGATLLVPAALLVAGSALVTGERSWPAAAFARAGSAMLVVYVPYAVLVLGALIAYAVLDWRWKYLASALMLGPFTLVRPLVAVVGAAVAALLVRDALVAATIALATAAVLGVEPLAGRLWYARAAGRRADARLRPAVRG